MTMASLLVLAIATIFGCAFGFTCSGQLNGQVINEDVFVKGKCTLTDVTIAGGVFVEDGAELQTAGSTTLGNSLKLKDAGKVILEGSLSVEAGVESETAEQLTIGTDAKLGGLMLSNTPSIISGEVTRIFASGTGNLTLTGATVSLGGVFASDLFGLVKMCGVTLKGGIEIVGGKSGLMAVAAQGCAPSELDGTIRVLDTMGSVRVVGGTLTAADIIVEKVIGRVELRNAAFSDAKFVGVEGDVFLDSCVLDSDATFEGTKGVLTVQNCVFDGDLAVTDTNATSKIDFMANEATVILRNNDFMLEDVTIAKNMGKVLVEDNKQFGGKFEGNGKVELMNNNATDVELVKNDEVMVVGNKAEGISCVDNANVMKVADNSVIDSAPADDQCNA